MTMQSNSRKKSPRRWFAPSVSLKMLMFMMTAAAVGSAFWWRWPVTATTEMRQGGKNVQEIATFHRGLRGDLIKHGVHRITVDREISFEEHFQEGLLHGPFLHVDVARGTYVAGKREGVWEFTSGKYNFRYEFHKGKLVAAPQSVSGKMLLKRMADGPLTNENLRNVLVADVDLIYSEKPFLGALEDLHNRFQLPLVPRSKRFGVLGRIIESEEAIKPPNDARVTVNENDWPLLAGLDSILTPLEFALDYRFGALCVVDAKDVEDWKDSTGVMELHPASDTTLADRLDAPAKPTFVEYVPVVLRNLGADQGISVELRLSGEEFQGPHRKELISLFREVSAIRGYPAYGPKEPLPITLRQLLGLILDQADLHCHEENGVLIIAPRPKEVATQAKRAMP